MACTIDTSESQPECVTLQTDPSVGIVPNAISTHGRFKEGQIRCYTFLNSGGRDGIRTHDLLIANEEKSMIRHGAAIT